jgi:hypothetical protein
MNVDPCRYTATVPSQHQSKVIFPELIIYVVRLRSSVNGTKKQRKHNIQPN